ncbi:hypothetical protein RchiOBHm_Chr3g0454941 [Rosa chinensis]|uniref:Uncharacterized protein n=1 Tax=Rosa chinensis TaxID=74649 RepID=A0A2P6R6X9_ROSCH|nr:hypothetical protein RchiOBHm_Chr3g0454941 [Rosa chinensis]
MSTNTTQIESPTESNDDDDDDNHVVDAAESYILHWNERSRKLLLHELEG